MEKANPRLKTGLSSVHREGVRLGQGRARPCLTANFMRPYANNYLAQCSEIELVRIIPSYYVFVDARILLLGITMKFIIEMDEHGGPNGSNIGYVHDERTGKPKVFTDAKSAQSYADMLSWLRNRRLAEGVIRYEVVGR